MSNDSSNAQIPSAPEGAPTYTPPPAAAPAAPAYGAPSAPPYAAPPAAPAYPGYPAYSGQLYAGQAYNTQAVRTNPLAITAMIAGIAGLTLLAGIFIASIAAVIMGHIAQKQIKTTGENGKGMALAGIITGYIGIALSLLVWIGFFVFMAWIGSIYPY